MITTKCKKFKGEIENYLRIGQHNFDVKIDRAFSSLKVRTLLCRSNILKRDGYPAAHLLFVLQQMLVSMVSCQKRRVLPVQRQALSLAVFFVQGHH